MPRSYTHMCGSTTPQQAQMCSTPRSTLNKLELWGSAVFLALFLPHHHTTASQREWSVGRKLLNHQLHCHRCRRNLPSRDFVTRRNGHEWSAHTQKNSTRNDDGPYKTETHFVSANGALVLKLDPSSPSFAPRDALAALVPAAG